MNETTNNQAYSYSSSSSMAFSAGSSRASMSPYNNFENMSPNSQWSYGQANIDPIYNSPRSSGYLTQPSSPSAFTKLPKRSEQIDMSDVIKQAAIQRALGGRAKVCTFCKTNGESEAIYMSHALKDANDKITCPILAKYSCPVCGANGDKTHTKRYCPVLQKKNKNEMLRKLTIAAASNNNESSNFWIKFFMAFVFFFEQDIFFAFLNFNFRFFIWSNFSLFSQFYPSLIRVLKSISVQCENLLQIRNFAF